MCVYMYRYIYIYTYIHMYIHTGSQCSEVGFDRGSVLKAAHTSSLRSGAVVVGVLIVYISRPSSHNNIIVN